LTEAQPPSINEGLRLINRYQRIRREIDEGLRIVPSLEELDEEARLRKELILPLLGVRKRLKALDKEPQFDPIIMKVKAELVSELYKLADSLNEIVF
jgi:hypothetical protein